MSTNYGSTNRNSDSSPRLLGPMVKWPSLSEVEEDLRLQSERLPLMNRVEATAHYRGARRAISVTDESLANLQREMDESDPIKRTWSKLRIFKVFVLTSICVLVTMDLLFLPVQKIEETVVSAQKNQVVKIDLATALNDSWQPRDNVLVVRVGGNLVPNELLLENQAEFEDSDNYAQIFFTLVDEDETNKRGSNKNNSKEDETWMLWVASPLSAYRMGVDYGEKEHSFHSDSLNSSALILTTTSNEPLPLSLSFQLVSSVLDYGVLLGAIILLAMYTAIISEVAHRTVITMMAAISAIAVLAIVDERPGLEELVTWVDVETMSLLFAMMIIVSILSETGIFNYVGFKAFVFTKGRTWPLITTLCLLTAAISAVLDNVTTILLMTPVIIQLCESVGLEPTQVLIANVIFSNIGGAATAIGDPPNVLIAADQSVQSKANVTFANFTLHMLLGVLPVLVIAYVQLRFMLSKLDAGSTEDKELMELVHEIKIWHRTAMSMSSYSREEAMVKSAIAAKIDELKRELDEKQASHKYNFRSKGAQDLDALADQCRITDKWLLIKAGCVLVVVIALFFLQNFPQFNLSLGWTALLGATTLLVLADRHEVESVFDRVEWSTLIFFATLFIVMEALSKLGLLEWIGSQVELLITHIDADYQLPVSLVLILWVSGLASAFIDNIPFTTMMIPVITSLGDSPNVQVPIQPLIWALAFGACLGGNGTLIGASANVVCAGVAEQHGYKFSFIDFFLVGFPVMIVSLIVATVYLLVCHCVFHWNG